MERIASILASTIAASRLAWETEDPDPTSLTAQRRERLRNMLVAADIHAVGALACVAATAYDAVNDHPAKAIVSGMLFLVTGMNVKHYTEEAIDLANKIVPEQPGSTT